MADSKVYNIEEYDESIEGTSTNHTQYIHDYPITTQDAKTAFDVVLQNAGASIVRDEVDERAVRSAQNRTAEVGTKGIVNYTDWAAMTAQTYSGTKELDSDNDGMPDSYEDEHGLNKTNESDALVKAASGYYNIEEYANSLAEVVDIPPATPGPTRNPNDPTPTPKPTAKPTATPRPTATSTPVPYYNISVSEGVTNGSVEINGTASRTVSWEASSHSGDIGGAKTLNWNGADSSDGTITMYDSTTEMFEYAGDGELSAKGNNNPSISVPVSSSKKPNGSVFMIKPASDGTINIEIYIYKGKSFNIYNNNDQAYIVKGDVYDAEGHYDYKFDCKANTEYYFWADGSKVGLKNATIIGGGASAKAGEVVTINTVPNNGFRTENVFTQPKCNVSKASENQYTFVMPNSDVVVGAEFADSSLPTMTPAPTEMPTAPPTSTPEPTAAPTSEPTAAPTSEPTATPVDKTVRYAGEVKIENGTVSAAIINPIDDEVLFIAAAYDENGMLAEIKTVIVPKSDKEFNVSETFRNGYSDIKLFLWSKETLKPYADVKYY